MADQATTPPPGGEPRTGGYYPAADDYLKAGWANPFPLIGKARNVPEGVTGREGRRLDRAEVAYWMTTSPNHNLALRLDGVIGIDVDNYAKAGVEKHGWQTMKLAIERWGPLPPTWRSTARPGTGASGIYFYRVPQGYLGLVSQLKMPDADGQAWSDVEIIQYHHRYAVVWPSTNPDADGAPYRWYDPQGNVVIGGVVPTVAELPELPAAWLQGLAELGVTEDPTLARQAVQVAPQHAPADAWHPKVAEHYHEGTTALLGGVGSRHDNVGIVVGKLARDEERGRTGATTAIDWLGQHFTAALEDGERGAEAEYRRMVDFSRTQAAATQSSADREVATLRHWAERYPPRGGPVHVTDPDPEPGPPGPPTEFLPGGAIFDEPEATPALWGSATEVLWAEGEPFMICAPPGVGKTTVAGQLVMGMVGMPGYEALLDLPVTPRAKVLYIAADRPRQIMRSLRRQADPAHRALLDEHLVIWKGPPPVDLALAPERLTLMAQEAGADVVVLDSLKDMAVGITDDKVGSGLNRAIQLAIAAGIEVLVLHHQRKGQNGEKPKTLEDVYGSTWLTAGMGSVALLWGLAGDMAVELLHLKQPAEAVGPLQIEHDHSVGRTTLAGGRWDALTYLRNIHPAGATTKEAAHAWFNKTPTRAEQMRAKRKLEALVKAGLVELIQRAAKGGNEGTMPAIYRVIQDCG